MQDTKIRKLITKNRRPLKQNLIQNLHTRLQVQLLVALLSTSQLFFCCRSLNVLFQHSGAFQTLLVDQLMEMSQCSC